MCCERLEVEATWQANQQPYPIRCEGKEEQPKQPCHMHRHFIS